MSSKQSSATFVAPICDRCKRLKDQYEQYILTSNLIGKKPSKKMQPPEPRRVDVDFSFKAVNMNGTTYQHYDILMCLECGDIMARVHGGTKAGPGHFETYYHGKEASQTWGREEKPIVTRIRVAPGLDKNKTKVVMKQFPNTHEWWDRLKEAWIPYHPNTIEASTREAEESYQIYGDAA